MTHAQPPDGRRYELVSPPAKGGNDVVSESSRTRAAAGEAPGLSMAATFASLGGFADVQGMGISTEYLAQRTGAPGTSGWSTHAITPPQAPMSLLAAAQGLDPLYEGDLSGDLTQGVFRAWSPLTADPDVAGVANLYLRGDLRTPGAGAYALLTGAAAPLAPLSDGSQRPYLAAATPDFRHVLFESRLALTPDAVAGNVMLYKADDGVVRLVAAGPACPGGRAPAAPCSIAGTGAAGLRLTARTLSDDGRRVTFATPVSPNGTLSVNPAGPSGVYQLDDGGTPSTADDTLVKLNASERTPPDTPSLARFQTASTDGERVFFTSVEQLTDASSGGLYLWRRTPPAGQGHLTLIAAGDANGIATLGASRDGGRVYFVALGQLIPGGPAVDEAGLYLWQDDGSPAGALSFVGGLKLADTYANDNTRFPWNQTPDTARVTPDGGELLFEASDGASLRPQADHGACADRNPNSSSNGACSELYLYRAGDSTPLDPDVVCVSCDPGGGAASASAFVNAHDGSGASQVTWHLSRALTDDGRRVFFSTAQSLVREDVNGRVDVYEYDVASRAVRLVSSGRDAADAWFMDASASGDDVFFTTREQLVGWDTDQSYDLYDARVGGGFPDPAPPPAPCAGDACRGPSHAPPPPVSLGSATFAGGGNPSASRAPTAAKKARVKRCRRGLVLHRVHGRARCVRRAPTPARRRRR